MTEATHTELLSIVDGLSDLERELLLGTSPGWGSWMWGVSSGLIAKGLFERTSDTSRGPSALGRAVVQHLLSNQERG